MDKARILAQGAIVLLALLAACDKPSASERTASAPAAAAFYCRQAASDGARECMSAAHRCKRDGKQCFERPTAQCTEVFSGFADNGRQIVCAPTTEECVKFQRGPDSTPCREMRPDEVPAEGIVR